MFGRLVLVLTLLSVVFCLPSVYEVHVGTTTRENKTDIQSIASCQITRVSRTYFLVRGDSECFKELQEKSYVVKNIRNSSITANDNHYVKSPTLIDEISTNSITEQTTFKRHVISIEWTFIPQDDNEIAELEDLVTTSVVESAGCSDEYLDMDIMKNAFGALNIYHGSPEECRPSNILPVLNEFYFIRSARSTSVSKHFNYWGSKVLQNGVLEPGSSDERYMESLGFTGDGEIIGIGDTGLDYNHCSFYDADNSVQFQATGSSCSSNSHRKIYCYITGSGDDTDYPANHGTHVSGTAAGSPSSSNSDASSGLPTPTDLRGGAPDAKIWFHDLQACSSSDTNCSDISNPSPFSTSYFEPAYNEGVRVHSSSWGSQDDYYPSNSVESDEFVWVFRDMVILFAAGNSAQDENRTSVFNSIGTPSDAKNIISVGATRSPQTEWNTVCNKMDLKSGDEKTICSQAVGSSEYDSMTLANFSSQGPINDGRIKPDFVAPGDPVISAASGDTSEPSTCSTVPGSDNYRWYSLQGTSMATPMLAGNIILLRQYLKSISSSVSTNMGTYAQNDIPAYFPSAALVRGIQAIGAYTLDKFLVAPLIESLTLGDPVNIRRNTLPFPSPHYGFGLPNYKNIISDEDGSVLALFDEGTIPGFTDSDQMRVLQFEGSADYSGSLEICLSWLDYPGEITDGRLIHDLDLILQSPSGRVFVGNHGVGGTEYALRNSDRYNIMERIVVPESLVSEEGTWSIIIYSYHVQTSALFNTSDSINGFTYPADVSSSSANINNTVPFTISFKGPSHPQYKSNDNEDLATCLNSCWEDGYERGTCNTSTKLCECNEGWTGLDCSHKITTLELGTAEFFDVAPYDRLIFKFTIDPPPAGVNSMNLGFRVRSGSNQTNIENWPSNNVIPWGKANTDVYLWRGETEPVPADWNRIDGEVEGEYGRMMMSAKDDSSYASTVQQRSGGADTNRVYIEDVEPGTYFALVINKDPVARGMLEIEAGVNPCSQGCNAAGLCTGNVCSCYEYYHGATCNKGTGNGALRILGSRATLLLLAIISLVSVATLI